MKTGINRVQLKGKLLEDPVVTLFDGKNKKAELLVITSEIFENVIGGTVHEEQRHLVIAWGEDAELAEKRLSKGDEVAIEGRIVNDYYTDKYRIDRFVSEIHVKELIILNAKK